MIETGILNGKKFIRCNLDYMIDKDLIQYNYGKKGNGSEGFTIGKRGKMMFHMWDPTQNGFYRLYEQNERGAVTGVRYVDGTKTLVTVWFKNENK